MHLKVALKVQKGDTVTILVGVGGVDGVIHMKVSILRIH